MICWVFLCLISTSTMLESFKFSSQPSSRIESTQSPESKNDCNGLSIKRIFSVPTKVFQRMKILKISAFVFQKNRVFSFNSDASKSIFGIEIDKKFQNYGCRIQDLTDSKFYSEIKNLHSSEIRDIEQHPFNRYGRQKIQKRFFIFVILSEKCSFQEVWIKVLKLLIQIQNRQQFHGICRNLFGLLRMIQTIHTW